MRFRELLHKGHEDNKQEYQTIPAKICVLGGTYQVQEILSPRLPLHVELKQQICSVDVLKTNKVVSIFLAILQQVYFLGFSPVSE